MDNVANRYARELIDAITAAIAADAQVQACRARARAAGFEIKVTLEALVGVVDEAEPAARARASVVPPSHRLPASGSGYEITAADRRFLRSLRISADEAAQRVE